MKHLNEEQLLGLLSGEIAADQQSHLKTCLECQQLRDEILQLRAELRQLPVPELPVSLQNKTWQLWEQHKAAQQQSTGKDDVKKVSLTKNAFIRWGLEKFFRWPVFLRYGGAVCAGFIFAVLLLHNHWSAVNSVHDASMNRLALTQQLEQQLLTVAGDNSQVQPIIQRYLYEINIIDSEISEANLSSHERQELWQKRDAQLKTVIKLYEHNSFIGEI